VVLGPIDAPDFLNQLAEFVHKVADQGSLSLRRPKNVSAKRSRSVPVALSGASLEQRAADVSTSREIDAVFESLVRVFNWPSRRRSTVAAT
jgi:hypothetical protein